MKYSNKWSGTCPRCGVVTHWTDTTCDNCGKGYIRYLAADGGYHFGCEHCDTPAGVSSQPCKSCGSNITERFFRAPRNYTGWLFGIASAAAGAIAYLITH